MPDFAVLSCQMTLFPMRILHALCLLSSLLLLNCQSGSKPDATEIPTNEPIPYNLSQPDERFELPVDLREISGLTYYKPGLLACVQDELAVVFLYDLKKRAVAREFVFGDKGDYEDLEWVDGRFYVLRSDGELYHFSDEGEGPRTVHHIKIDLPGKNDVEGLGYDPKRGTLLLATKDAAKGGSDKPIYYYDLKQQGMWQGPVLKQADLKLFSGTTGQPAASQPDVKPSGIAVHPQTGDYYLLAADGHRLVVMNPKGVLRSSVAIDANILLQPEGICFAPDGTLFIASEGGKKGKGLIVSFAPKAGPQ